ncbi:MAG TPA: hypothetical protein VN636_20615, partial [Acidimicrobiia bacterium]|nr:hypothetical protein [Acidimicrobiia bacterium]
MVLAGLLAAGVAALVDRGGDTWVLCLFGMGVVLGEMLVFRLSDGSALPLSYAVFLVLASSAAVGQYAAVVAGAELIAFAVVRVRDPKPWWARLVLRGLVAAATFAVCWAGFDRLPAHEKTQQVLVVLGVAALAQV